MASPFNCRIIEPSLIHILVLYLLCTYTIYLLTDNCCITLYVRLTPFDFNAFFQNKVIHFWEEVKMTAFFFFLSFFFFCCKINLQNLRHFFLLAKSICLCPFNKTYWTYIFRYHIENIFLFFMGAAIPPSLSPLSFFLSIFLFSSFTPS